jgi:hypothetical protein
MQIDKESLPDFWTGAITVGKTPVQLSSASQPIRKGIHIRVGTLPAGALLSIGCTNAVGTIGFIVPAGETSPLLYVDDLSKLWLVSSEDNTPITWIAF